ncbi:MAG: hypothetical protein IJ955_02195 [Oscillospiraceae bacterium]|nr:hypothetical protein [Oscillospiraceae bacterium]
MNFWKEHTSLRAGLMTLFFVVGLIFVIAGWKMTGQLAGLGLMLIGIILLLTTLFLYNKPYQGKKHK